jgi:hypothetical protein
MAPQSSRRFGVARVIASAGAVCGIFDGLSAVGVLGLFSVMPAQLWSAVNDAAGAKGPAESPVC